MPQAIVSEIESEKKRHNELVARDLEGNVFQIVDARTLHANGILHRLLLLLRRAAARIFVPDIIP